MKKRKKLSKKKQKQVSRKIRKLVNEGYDVKQAAAIAYKKVRGNPFGVSGTKLYLVAAIAAGIYFLLKPKIKTVAGLPYGMGAIC